MRLVILLIISGIFGNGADDLLPQFRTGGGLFRRRGLFRLEKALQADVRIVLPFQQSVQGRKEAGERRVVLLALKQPGKGRRGIQQVFSIAGAQLLFYIAAHHRREAVLARSAQQKQIVPAQLPALEQLAGVGFDLHAVQKIHQRHVELHAGLFLHPFGVSRHVLGGRRSQNVGVVRQRAPIFRHTRRRKGAQAPAENQRQHQKGTEFFLHFNNFNGFNGFQWFLLASTRYSYSSQGVTPSRPASLPTGVSVSLWLNSSAALL